MTVEIERKFMVARPPTEDVLGLGVPYRQGYLAGEDDVECRVRIGPNGSWITIKAGGGVARTEVQVAISSDEAEALWPHTAGRRLEKVRFQVAVEGAVAEVDRYAGELDGLWTVEVEFGDETTAAAFVPPAWFGPELTNEAGWGNAALARRGRPPV